MSDELFQLVYRSTHGGFDKNNLQGLTHEAEGLSDTYSITGFILVEDEDFFVLMEGSPIAVVSSLACIVQDPRHDSIKVLSAEVLTKRRCLGWRVLDSEKFAGRAEFLDWKVGHGDPAALELPKHQLDAFVSWLAEAIPRYAIGH